MKDRKMKLHVEMRLKEQSRTSGSEERSEGSQLIQGRKEAAEIIIFLCALRL